MSELKAIDFFCGAGGVTCGFKQAGVDVLGGIDNELAFKDTYEKNNDAHFLHKDISDLTPEELVEKFGIDKDDPNLIFIGCSPCQYYSNIRTDKSKSSESRLLLDDFKKFVDEFQPGFVFVENVPGFEKDEDSPLQKFKIYLGNSGYFFDDKIINAKDYGIPQNRRRYVLIASKSDRNIKVPTGDPEHKLLVEDILRNSELFPPIEAGHKDDSDFIHWTAKLSDLNLKRISQTPIDGGNRLAWADDPELQLDCYKGRKGHEDVYGRMRWSDVAPTITTKFHSLSNGRYGHPEQNRAISLREGASLQSFPEDYLFYSNSMGLIAKMIGNAVPPLLAQKICCAFFGSK